VGCIYHFHLFVGDGSIYKTEKLGSSYDCLMKILDVSF